MKPLAEQTLYEILEVPFDAPDGEILRACERVQALFGPGSVATYSLIDPEEVKVLGERIEEARSVLLDPASRADYDDRITAPPPGLFPARAPAPAAARVELPPPLPVAEVAAPVAAPGPALCELAVAPEPWVAVPAAEVAAEVAAAAAEIAPAAAEVAPAAAEAAPAPADAPAPAEVAAASIAVAALAEQPAPPAAPPAQLIVKRRRRRLPPVIRPLASPKPLPPAPPPDAALVAPAPAASPDAGADPAPLPIPLERVATPIPLATPVVPIPLAIPATPVASIPLATPVPISPPFAAIAAPPPAPTPVPIAAAPPRPPEPVPARAPRPPERDIFLHEGTRFTGEVLRRAREARGLTVVQLCERTKITRHHIEHLEADRYDKLPAVVYLRGILMAVSKELRLDGQKVAKSYLEAIAAATGAPLTTPRR